MAENSAPLRPLKQPGDEGFVDVLEEDAPLAGQKFACLSFLSPEKIIEHKGAFMFDEFLKQWELSKGMEKFVQFLSFLSFKYKLEFEALNKDLQEFAEEEKDQLFKSSMTLHDEFKTFLDQNEEKLNDAYGRANHFVTNVRGIKVGGTFPTQGEAELRAKILRERNPNHDIFIGPVGIWLPFDPEAYKTGRTEYLESELNELMKEKKNNEQKATDNFAARIKEAKERAVKDNIEKAKTSGNKLTQTLDGAGNLVSVKDVATFDNALLAAGKTETEELREELFSSDNIPTSAQSADTPAAAAPKSPSAPATEYISDGPNELSGIRTSQIV